MVYGIYIYIYKYVVCIYQDFNTSKCQTGTDCGPLAPAGTRCPSVRGKKTGLSTDLHGSFWSPVSLVGMPHRSDLDRLSRCHMVSHIAVLAKHRKSTQ